MKTENFIKMMDKNKLHQELPALQHKKKQVSSFPYLNKRQEFMSFKHHISLSSTQMSTKTNDECNTLQKGKFPREMMVGDVQPG